MKIIDLVLKQNYSRINEKGLEILKNTIISNDCPSFYGYNDSEKKDEFCLKKDCIKCWEREV